MLLGKKRFKCFGECDEPQIAAAAALCAFSDSLLRTQERRRLGIHRLSDGTQAFTNGKE